MKREDYPLYSPRERREERKVMVNVVVRAC